MPDNARVKSLRCNKCQCAIAPDMKLLKNTVDDCKHNKRRSHIHCGLKQTLEFFERMHAKANGEPKKIPLLLMNQNTTLEKPEEEEDVEERNVPNVMLILVDRAGNRKMQYDD